MDKELAKRWLKLPEVEIEYEDSVLMVNGKFVSLPDITSDMLSDYIEIGHQKINNHLQEMRKRDQFWGNSKVRPLVLVGRLALTSDRPEVFIEEGLHAQNEAAILLDQVNQAYHGYWKAVEKCLYTPLIRRNLILNDPKLDGTWLGLRRP